MAELTSEGSQDSLWVATNSRYEGPTMGNFHAGLMPALPILLDQSCTARGGRAVRGHLSPSARSLVSSWVYNHLARLKAMYSTAQITAIRMSA
jgi:hypothetical protein